MKAQLLIVVGTSLLVLFLQILQMRSGFTGGYEPPDVGFVVPEKDMLISAGCHMTVDQLKVHLETGREANVSECSKMFANSNGTMAVATLIHAHWGSVYSAMKLGHSVKGLSVDKIALLSHEGSLTETMHDALKKNGWSVCLSNEQIEKDATSAGCQFPWNYRKLEVWSMPYNRVLYMDSDTLAVQSIRELLVQHMAYEIAGVQSDGGTRNFNAGVMLIKTNQKMFDEMSKTFTQQRICGTEEVYLNNVFKDNWQQIGDEYNVRLESCTAKKTCKVHPRDVRVLHYMGRKPWYCQMEWRSACISWVLAGCTC